MKKALSLILVLIMCLSLCACGDPSGVKESTGNGNEESATLELLNSVYSYCHTGMNYMLRAWDFSIQHSTDSTREEYEALWDEFAGHMGMTEQNMVDGLMNEFNLSLDDLSLGKDASRGLNTTINGMMFMDASNSVPVARYVFKERNKDTDPNAKLEQIKSNLQKISDSSKAYELLKEYYLMVSEMAKWVESPSGNYNSSTENLNTYEKRSENFKQELDLLIG